MGFHPGQSRLGGSGGRAGPDPAEPAALVDLDARPELAPPQAYQLTTKHGTTIFQTGEDWLAAWAKLVRSCKAARALDKLQIARQTNQAHIAAVAAFDAEPAAILNAQLDKALSIGRQGA